MESGDRVPGSDPHGERDVDPFGDEAGDEPSASTAGEDADIAQAGTAPPASEQTPLTQQLGRIVLVVLAALFLAFAFVNRQAVRVDWVVADSSTPLIVLLVGAFVLGVVIGAGLLVRRQRRVTKGRAAERSD
jgi:uncharacterized integral membrane protein